MSPPSFLGANIVTTKDEAWSRQRRIVAPALTERIMSEVWRESAEQATSFADILLASSSSAAREAGQTMNGLRTIAMNVLARIAYGHRKPFVPHAPVRDATSSMSYVDAIALCTQLLVVAALFPVGLLTLLFMPSSLQCLGVALQNLPELTKNMLESERHKDNGSMEDRSDTIMSTLVRLSDHDKEQADGLSVREGSVSKSYLTDDEIAGNLFMFTAAGLDTTANTMSYACALLAAYPQWQTWIQDELNTVLSLTQPNYATPFPNLIRCMAVMIFLTSQTCASRDANRHDSLKPFASSPWHHGASVNSVRSIAHGLITSHKVLVKYKSTRWLCTRHRHTGVQMLWSSIQLAGNKHRKAVENRHSQYPPRGRFIPWSMGPRVCSGQKMSQVEFVAVIATLFRSCNAQPVINKGEDTDGARQRLLDLMQDSQAVLTLQMNRPKGVLIQWTNR